MNEIHVKEEILSFLNRDNRSFTTRDAISFMALIRTIMEHLDNKENWKVINFYCNWTLHTQLSQSNYGYTTWIFDLLANTLNNHLGNSQAITTSVTTAVGLDTLKNDTKLFLRNIFTVGELSEENSELSNDFIETIAYLILDRPVFNKKNNAGLYTSGMLNITHPTSGATVYVSKIMVTDSDSKAMLSIYLDPAPPLHPNNDTPFQIVQINQLA